MLHCRLTLALLALVPFAARSAPPVEEDQASDAVEKLVMAHYPEHRLEPEGPYDRRSCHAVLAGRADGAPSRIVAGYGDSSKFVLRVLQRQPDDAFLVVYDSPEDLHLYGLFCEIELADIDGDGAAEVFFEDIGGKGSSGWVFRDRPVGLENITPVDGRLSELLTPSLVDLYHDGTLQIVTAAGSVDESSGRLSVGHSLYRFREGRLRLDGRVLLIAAFSPDDAVFIRRRTFSQVVGEKGPYILRLTNGRRDGTLRVSGVTITINGTPLPGTTVLTAKRAFLELPIDLPLQDENTIEVSATGAPRAGLTVTIR